MAKSSEYDGPVVFCADGVHYPTDKDGNADLSRPLRWVDGATYRDAEPDEPKHNDVHFGQHLEIEPGTE